jgi:hypothetical protein
VRTCKNPSCKKRFEPQYSTLQKACSVGCAAALAGIERHKEDKRSWTKEKKERQERLMTASDWRRLLQITFNTFIRVRDQGKPCISCARPLVGKFDAGHFYSVGSYPNLRYHEDNVWGQCVHCNRDKHGNPIEYGIKLPLRIGQERFEALQSMRNTKLQLTVPEIQELITVYKKKIKDLKK